ncbi:MAG: hypothetical protein ABI467_04120 [Kofleriaceae bacterium]
MKSVALITLLLAAACGGDDTNTKTDSGNGSGSGSGSNTNKVQTVACTGATVTATVSTDDTVNTHYIYSTGSAAPSISVGQVIEFKTTVRHNVAPALAGSDPGIAVDYSSDVCKKFTAAGTYGFYCSMHGLTGSVTVN